MQASVQRILVAAALGAAALLFVHPFLGSGPIPWGMDLSFAAQVSHGMIEGLRAGEAYPRWIDEMSRRFGAPALLFYPPLAYYAVAALWPITGGIVESLRWIVIGSTLLCGWSFYASARPRMSRLAATAGGILYIWLPYHAVDLYDRFAFAEFVAFVWIPPLFRFVHDLADGAGRRALLGLALTFAGLTLTHIVTAFLSLLVLGPFALALVARRRAWKRLVPMLGAGVLAGLLCGAYLVPMLAQRAHANTEHLSESAFGQWQRNFAFRDETRLGFNPSKIKPTINRSIATQGIVGGVALSWLLAGWWRRRGSRSHDPDGVPIAIWGGLALWTVALQLPISTPVWALVPGLETAQFPWRYGTLQGLTTAMLVAMAIERPPPFAWKSAAATRAIPALALIAIASVPAFSLSWSLFGFRNYVFTNELALEPRVQTKVLSEYMPNEIDPKLWKQRVGSAIATSEGSLLQPGELEQLDHTPSRRRFRVSSTTENALRLTTFWFPGWEARIAGEPLELRAESPLGNMIVAIPEGSYVVDVAYMPTRDRVVGAWLSALGLLGVLGLGGLSLRDLRRPAR